MHRGPGALAACPARGRRWSTPRRQGRASRPPLRADDTAQRLTARGQRRGRAGDQATRPGQTGPAKGTTRKSRGCGRRQRGRGREGKGHAPKDGPTCPGRAGPGSGGLGSLALPAGVLIRSWSSRLTTCQTYAKHGTGSPSEPLGRGGRRRSPDMGRSLP